MNWNDPSDISCTKTTPLPLFMYQNDTSALFYVPEWHLCPFLCTKTTPLSFCVYQNDPFDHAPKQHLTLKLRVCTKTTAPQKKEREGSKNQDISAFFTWPKIFTALVSSVFFVGNRSERRREFQRGGGRGQVSRAIKGERFRVTSPPLSFAISYPSARIFSAEKGSKNVEI